MKLLSYVVAFLAGVGIVSLFFEGNPVHVGIQNGQFLSVFGEMWAIGFMFSSVDELRKKFAPGFNNFAWLGVLGGCLALFFVGAALCRFAYLLIQGISWSYDGLALVLLLLSLAVVTGVGSAKIAGAFWRSKR